MSHLVPGQPKPAKPQQAKVITIVSPKVKLFLVLVGLLVYIYVLMFAKSLYLKDKRLDRTSVMAMETERMIHKVHTMDQNMATNMERFDNAFGDY